MSLSKMLNDYDSSDSADMLSESSADDYYATSSEDEDVSPKKAKTSNSRPGSKPRKFWEDIPWGCMLKDGLFLFSFRFFLHLSISVSISFGFLFSFGLSY